eukprot:COSAG03_NODE_66_length_15090_cov_6.646455_12_plen_114_part_00
MQGLFSQTGRDTARQTGAARRRGASSLQAGSAAGWAPALVKSPYEGLKTNEDVIGVAAALDDVFEEIDQDLDGGLRARQLQCGSDNGAEFTNADVARVMNKWLWLMQRCCRVE